MGEVRLQGIGVSRGVGIGTAVVLKEEELKIEHILVEDEEKERKRFEAAVSTLKQKNQELSEQLSESVGEKDGQIILAHNAVLEDPEIIEPILKMIQEFRVNAEAAVEEVFNKAIQTMSSLEDDRMKERVSDLEDVKQGLLRLLLNIGEMDFSKINQNTILVTKELSPHVSAMLDGDKIAGIITQRGGPTSHAAIISKAMEIPAVVGVEDAVELIPEGEFVVMDGENGTVILNPEEKTRKSFERRKKKVQAEKESLKEYIGLNSISKDGVLFEVQANAGSLQDTKRAMEQDAQGIGLYRTEFLFMNRDTIPSEEEQFTAYKEAVVCMEGRPLVIRTLDAGGDKPVEALGLKEESNPFLGYRAIRYCIQNPEVFTVQIRAILRASAFGPIKILIPFITCLEEFEETKKLIDEEMIRLIMQDIPFDARIPVGIMMETPSAVMMADILAKYADFFSIGTNDLTQYTMAVDRGNSKVSDLYSVYYPSVIRAMKRIIEEGDKNKIPVAMCGEAASDPYFIPVLMGMGLREFSVIPSEVLKVRGLIRKWTIPEAEALCQEVMKQKRVEKVKELLEKAKKI
ncbi:MAG: phosphoenolpyruvate--protein phosphotransferase [Lachnospiraceae bacterium]|nr:phosphoenolpyruvate--protein phosphotransferase [Lachnospiraceae bacterium]